MTTNALARPLGILPSLMDDFFKPWNEWFDNGGNRMFTVPGVNVSETKEQYSLDVAAPGLKKEDFRINVEGNILSISASSEVKKEEKEGKYNRLEYNYSSFSRSFTLPNEVLKDKIDARYEDGVLRITLPRRQDAASPAAASIAVK